MRPPPNPLPSPSSPRSNPVDFADDEGEGLRPNVEGPGDQRDVEVEKGSMPNLVARMVGICKRTKRRSMVMYTGLRPICGISALEDMVRHPP